jgi:hypothetical protein
MPSPGFDLPICDLPALETLDSSANTIRTPVMSIHSSIRYPLLICQAAIIYIDSFFFMRAFSKSDCHLLYLRIVNDFPHSHLACTWEPGMEADYATARPPSAVNKVRAELVLDEPHLAVFDRALSNVLATEIAEETFAQIVDGLPLARVAFSIRSRRDTIYDPVFKHEELCDGVLDKTRSFREDFVPAKLELEDHVGNSLSLPPARHR